MSGLDLFHDDPILRSDLSLDLYGSGIGRGSLGMIITPGASADGSRKTPSTSALQDDERDRGTEKRFRDHGSDHGNVDEVELSPVLGANTADVAGSAVKQQPWFPLETPSSTADVASDSLGRGLLRSRFV